MANAMGADLHSAIELHSTPLVPRDVVWLGMDAEKACIPVCIAREAMWPVESLTESRTWTRASTGLEARGNFHVAHLLHLGELEDSLRDGDMPSLWIWAGSGLVNATPGTGTQRLFRPTSGLTFIPTGMADSNGGLGMAIDAIETASRGPLAKVGDSSVKHCPLRAASLNT
jgi:hypothetical protein